MSNDYNDLTGGEYELLYARYLKHPERLLVASGVPLNSKTRLLDLCSGSGLVVRAAVALGVKPENIAAVEASGRMVAWSRDFGCAVEITPIELFLQRPVVLQRFDLITCRQAVNYWWWGTEKISQLCRSRLAPGGVFVFNTFNAEPSPVPQIRQYTEAHGVEGAHTHFVEVSWLDGALVHHVQVRSGMRPHMTSFLWISPTEFARDLDELVKTHALASWERQRDGTTDTYICRGA